MGKPDSKKRKGMYYSQAAKKKRYNKLDAGMKGVMITCNNREREAIKEAYNLLDEYAEVLHGPPKEEHRADEGNENTSSGEEEDIATALKKEVDELKKTKSSEKRFQQVDTGARNVLFIKTTVESHHELINKIFSDCLQTKEKKSRFIIRMLPILGTCHANEDQIPKTMCKLVEPYIGHGKPTSYCFQIKVRNNDSLSRTGLIHVLGRAVEDSFPNARVDLNDAEHIITIDVMKTVACIGCVQEYDKYRKYNLQEITTETKDKAKDTICNKEDDKSEGKLVDENVIERDTKDNEDQVPEDSNGNAMQGTCEKGDEKLETESVEENVTGKCPVSDKDQSGENVDSKSVGEDVSIAIGKDDG